ncbi:pumilio domain member 4 [Perkinsus chesapeaki]|uniref:Pumilio domain member 4 n=1 Tax=Perkinsus chesapeaki TaxID=330153 RepID=A0A7J6L0P8_PERCH|nr:pumilio domain member 4 [Perkinsus chesapeaki]
MVFVEVAAVLGGIGELFMYNRETYQYNRELNQERIFQLQKLRVNQVQLYREDLRDLFELTIGKMDNYLVINTLTLGFVMGFYYEAKTPEEGTPSWLIFLWALNLASAVFFLVMSIWFSIHASITAQTFAVRLLTQWMRLPVPGQEEINAACADLRNYERKGVDTMFRIPIVSNYMPVKGPRAKEDKELREAPPKILQSNEATEDLGTDYNIFVEHFYLFNRLKEHWQGFDAYARVFMVLGTNQLVNVLCYMGLMFYFISYNFWGPWIFILLMLTFDIIHERMNLLLTPAEHWTLTVLQVAGPILAGFAATFDITYRIRMERGVPGDHEGWIETVDILTPIIYFLHFLFIGYFISLGLEPDGELPTKFAMIMSIDVLGLDEEQQHRKMRHMATVTKQEAPVSELIPQTGSVKVAQAIHKKKTQELSGHLSSIPEESQSSSSSSTIAPNGPSATDGQARRIGRGITREADALAMGRALQAEEKPSLTKTFRENSAKAKILPWRIYKAGGAVVAILWLFGVGYTCAIAAGATSWGWNNKAGLVEEGGEEEGRRLQEACAPAFEAQRLNLLEPGPFFYPTAADVVDSSLVLADEFDNKWSFPAIGGKLYSEPVETSAGSVSYSVQTGNVYRNVNGVRMAQLHVPYGLVAGKPVGACGSSDGAATVVTDRGEYLTWTSRGIFSGAANFTGSISNGNLDIKDCAYRDSALLVLGNDGSTGEAQVWLASRG